MGGQIINQFGSTIAAGRPFLFSFRDSRVPIDWKVKWYTYDSALNPISNPADWKQIISQSPVLQQETKTLDYAWWGGIAAGGKQIEKFGTLATGEFDVLPGSYELSTTWDDAVRVYLDGRLVVDEWNPSKYTFDESPNKAIRLQLNGHHSLRVEHVELGGFATLSLKLRKL
jgi:hypothetical protein